MALRSVLFAFVLLTTTASVADAQLVRVTYPIGDLVTPKPGVPGAQASILVDMLIKTVAPASWKEFGGQGECQYFPFGQALVIVHSQEMQESIQIFLANLRKLNQVEMQKRN